MALVSYYISTDITGGVLDSVKLDSEITVSGHVTGFTGLTVEGDRIDVLGSSIANMAGLNAVIAAHEAVTLQEYKQAKNQAIDLKTVSLISAGFTFDSQSFSLSANAQINWLGLKTLESLLTWPVNVTTLTDGEYSLTQANLDSFIGAGKTVLQGHLDSGRSLKVSVNAATTKAEVDVVVDNR